MNFLTDEEKADLKALHRKERDKRVCDRIKAVLLYDKGWTFLEIADALLLSEEAVRHHFSEYKSSKKLKPESGGSNKKLSMEQSQALSEHLEKFIYLYVKDIIAYVAAEWKVSYTVPGMQHWLKRHGFSYKKPAIVRKYLETSKIELHFLPPYSPNLNPIERLWKWMKDRVMYNTYYKEFEDFKLAILGFFRLLANTDPKSELGQNFRSRVRDKFSPMGAPATI